MANLFLLSRKAFVMCYCFRAPIKTFFFDACQMTVKSCVLHLFPVPQTGRSHIINILLASFFGPYCKLRILVFFPSIYGQRAWAINRWKKHSVGNLQYGPKTRLIRGRYAWFFALMGKKCTKTYQHFVGRNKEEGNDASLFRLLVLFPPELQ